MKKIFISYSWESDEHKQFVKQIAGMLEEDGLEVKLDQWDLKPGDELALYMEKAITESDYVLVVCSEGYKRKADGRLGGSGYEAKLMATSVSMNQHIKKFIPIYVGGDWNSVSPEFLKGNLYVDLNHDINSKKFELSYTDLLTTILGISRKKKNNSVDAKERLAKRLGVSKSELLISEKGQDEDVDVKILGIIVDEVTIPKKDGSRGSALYSIPFELNKRPEYDWSKYFIASWNHPPRFTMMHRPGIAEVRGEKIFLNGTTIEEVKSYHRDTLVLAVNEANEKYRQQKLNQKAKKERDQINKHKHFDNLSKHVDDISF
ncbi:toll/interleukin-1 receptor domain-containing protein [Rossellomorea sp. FM04394]|uniref:toll/interleukin-1 receptor domain-containing protein n=1 Tax=Rossellomorea sp. FM04394 TaxID=3243076 RepID=UPI0035A57BE9